MPKAHKGEIRPAEVFGNAKEKINHARAQTNRLPRIPFLADGVRSHQ